MMSHTAECRGMTLSQLHAAAEGAQGKTAMAALTAMQWQCQQ